MDTTLSEIATSKEIDAKLTSLEDRIDNRMTQSDMKMYRALLIQTGAMSAIVFGMLQLVVG